MSRRPFICVTAICKNEESFAERFMRSASEADAVTVLDTGSADGTVGKLRSLGALVETAEITPWRFDRARNEALRLIPPETDIAVAVDLDEYFSPGWAEKLRAAWKPGTLRMSCRYVWNFLENGAEGIVFELDKFFSPDCYVWTNPVHEVLKYTGTGQPETVHIGGVQLNHRADDSKPRSSYLPLLELAVAEQPDNDRNVHYLGREYMFYGRYDEAIETLVRHLSLPTARWADERAASCRYAARCFAAKGDTGSALSWFLRAVAEAPHAREGWVEAAMLCSSLSDWHGAVWLSEKSLEITERPLSYISEPFAWDGTVYDLLALGLWHTGDRTGAVSAEEKAHSLSPSDSRIAANLEYMKDGRNKAE